jgi:trehalose-6-phosphate synthase
LILSEFAGAARCLAGARLVNPFDSNDFVEAINEALTLSEEGRSFLLLVK